MRCHRFRAFWTIGSVKRWSPVTSSSDWNDGTDIGGSCGREPLPPNKLLTTLAALDAVDDEDPEPVPVMALEPLVADESREDSICDNNWMVDALPLPDGRFEPCFDWPTRFSADLTELTNAATIKTLTKTFECIVSSLRNIQTLYENWNATIVERVEEKLNYWNWSKSKV